MTAQPELPSAIRDRLEQLRALALKADVNEAALLMVQQLHIALYGDTWARPESPSRVWEQMLAEVIGLRDGHSTPDLNPPERAATP